MVLAAWLAGIAAITLDDMFQFRLLVAGGADIRRGVVVLMGLCILSASLPPTHRLFTRIPSLIARSLIFIISFFVIPFISLYSVCFFADNCL